MNLFFSDIPALMTVKLVFFVANFTLFVYLQSVTALSA